MGRENGRDTADNEGNIKGIRNKIGNIADTR